MVRDFVPLGKSLCILLMLGQCALEGMKLGIGRRWCN